MILKSIYTHHSSNYKSNRRKKSENFNQAKVLEWKKALLCTKSWNKIIVGDGNTTLQGLVSIWNSVQVVIYDKYTDLENFQVYICMVSIHGYMRENMNI